MDFAISENSLVLVLQKQTREFNNSHDKNTNKIRETHFFWKNIFNYGAICLHVVICKST